MRHTDAGLAIPDFPLAFGHLIPPHWDPKIAIHFAHRVGALVVTIFAIATTGHVFYHHRSRRSCGGRRSAARPARPADHARRADGAEPQAVHHQLAARRHRRVRAGHVARADAPRPSRQLRQAHRIARTRRVLRTCIGTCVPFEVTREDKHADRRAARRFQPRVPRAVSRDRVVHWTSSR